MTNTSKIKVYQEVLDKIRQFIEANSLSEGDRLPSERELAEQLNASRSSVREALRAIELLGLIETKHGEGTFLKTYRPYHTVELLATFVLRQPTTKHELLEVRHLLEEQCLSKLISSEQQSFKELIDSTKQYNGQDLHTFVFSELFELVDNELFYKIWHLINNFSQTTYSNKLDYDRYINLVLSVESQDLSSALQDLNSIYEK
ncbi:FadR/GntR family transcriptional regulator [Piscibacillus salipiscarius]|uniref:FadR/GntR family transcriptional regulator n=1 Tax=Piscibacillus salipiscarius TaxID=299480 RepID=A0ABW5QD66_9BACI|nr:GntR family transcriptional regulator [Piscibacillus salipiscarius]